MTRRFATVNIRLHRYENRHASAASIVKLKKLYAFFCGFYFFFLFDHVLYCFFMFAFVRIIICNTLQTYFTTNFTS